MNKKLAIKGHKIRGKEVIEILKMLGGVNKYKISDANLDLLYTIRSHDKFIISVYPTDTFIVFTLEEFLKKFPYKVGDKVKVPYEDGRLTGNELYEYKILKIKWDYLESTIKYGLPTGDDQCIEYYSTDNLNIWNKKETMESKPNLLQHLKEYFDNTPRDVIEKEWNELSYLNEIGPTVEEYLESVKKYRQTQYPKTFTEVLNFWHPDRQPEDDYQRCYKKDLIEKFQDLLYAKDAYWKIAGEKMGLGKPWEPDLENEELYCIQNYNNQIVKSKTNTAFNKILIFPTEEMRDAFYENFKDLIEQCKELL